MPLLTDTIIDHVLTGDIIVELDDSGTKVRKTTVVKAVHIGGCKNHVHINGSQCWDRGYPVTIKQA